MNQVPYFFRVFSLNGFPFRFTNLLTNNLLGSLGSNPAKILHVNQ